MKAFALASLALLSACGPSAYARHARALEATRVVLDGAAVAIEEGCAARARALPPGIEGTADAVRLRERCETAADAHDAARAAWRTWLDALAIAVAGDDAGLTATLLSAAVAAVRAYGAIAEALADFGIAIPSVPAPAAALLVGGEP